MANKVSQEDQAALDYHALPRPGKIGIEVTKSAATQADLARAYTPGVAAPVLAIAEKPARAYRYTSRGNLVAVISNGSAILGLGNLGALASKPVMEGKALLFKRFADVDVFDIEVDAYTPEELIQTITHIAPTFGGINLEDIKAPECFIVEDVLRERLDIPVFHDDQHGTAITLAAGLLNALELQGKTLADAKIVCLGAGAAGIASMRLLMELGASRTNIYMIDRQGIIHDKREDLNPYKLAMANSTDKRTLADAMEGADVFIGVSGANLLPQELLDSMAEKPIIFALSNPDPEIKPALVKQRREDAILATGRSDFPNQINNVLCFPYIFRGALDAWASKINIPMQKAAVEALRELTHESIPDSVHEAYPDTEGLSFGPDYIIPRPFDPRLKEKVSSAVYDAAVASGVSRKEGE